MTYLLGYLVAGLVFARFMGNWENGAHYVSWIPKDTEESKLKSRRVGTRAAVLTLICLWPLYWLVSIGPRGRARRAEQADRRDEPSADPREEERRTVTDPPILRLEDGSGSTIDPTPDR